MTAQSATQTAPARYFVRLSHRRAARLRRSARLREALQDVFAAYPLEHGHGGHACVRRVSIICTTVQASTIAARMRESAAPYPSFRYGNELR